MDTFWKWVIVCLLWQILMAVTNSTGEYIVSSVVAIFLAIILTLIEEWRKGNI